MSDLIPSFVKTRAKSSTALPPACIQIAPHDPSCILLGTYLLDDTATTLEARKTGSIERWHFNPDDGKLELLQTVPAPGAILDLKFSPHSPGTFAIATTLGAIHLYTISRDTSEISSAPVQTLQVSESREDLILSVNFSPTNAAQLSFTVTTGEIGVVEITGAPDEAALWGTHSLEAWTCEYTQNGNGLYSGGDDSVITFRDLRMDMEVWRDRKTHQAGVTAVLSSPEMEARGEIISGSYDEVMRVWDVRGARRRVVDEVELGGGVWRVGQMGDEKWIVSGMQAGPRTVERKEGKLEAVKRWDAMNLNYGCSWAKEKPERIAWCSFYDKVVCVDDIGI